MSPTFYLPRRLSSNDHAYTEKALLGVSNFVVILAEPGGGKTELMRSFAQQLGTSIVTANVFRHLGAETNNGPLVIDAFDELSKIDKTGIHSLLANARKAHPTHVFISSRSSEWGTSATNSFEEFFGQKPLVVRLYEFDETEQRAIFDHHVKGEIFSAFRNEVARFNLESLLPNPQFLKLFADAYIESNRHFTDKKSIFSQAVDRLAKEANANVARVDRALSTTHKVELSSEVFAKLLLSGAEGIGTNEATEDRIYPLLASLFRDSTVTEGILATRLFKPGDSADQHRPVHKIVAEYCAADYLTKRMADPADLLTFQKCLPIIAPNLIVRDELRGLLGWMASLGSKSIQESAIKLDPYAVLANGDPSQLEHSSKRLLVQHLKEVEDKDPYFRRGDFWRRFSVAGFFTQEVMEEIKPILFNESDGHLRDLILELLTGSPAIELLKDELRKLALTKSEIESTRLLAVSCLTGVADYDHRELLTTLIQEASQISLKIAKNILETLGKKIFSLNYYTDFLRACFGLYPSQYQDRGRTIGTRHFIKKFIEGLDIALVESLLDELTIDLLCVCKKKSYECECRNGRSKIVGSLLDRYFELTAPPYDPKRIWKWTENLNYHEQKSADYCKSIHVLQHDNTLRQGIISHVFGKLTDSNQIFETKIHKFDLHSHSGLRFLADDYRFIIDLSFETGNSSLWASFMARHQYYRKKPDQGADTLRRQMRMQALKDPRLMREWSRFNRAAAQSQRENRKTEFRYARKIKRTRKQWQDIRTSNKKYIQANQKLIESGRHWNSLVHFAELILMSPNEIEQQIGDELIVRTALRNCLDFIAPEVPDLFKLAKLQCASQGKVSETVLFAACVEIMRAEGNLERVDLRLLNALRTHIDMSYSAISGEERDTLKTEVDRLIFSDVGSAERFLRQYVEPQLAEVGCPHPEIWLLRSDKVFSHLRGALSIEWLHRFRGLGLSPLSTLFEVAAQSGNRIDLQKIIAERCASFMFEWPSLTDNSDIERERIFWLVRALYFLEDTPETYWNWLKADRETIFLLNSQSGRINHDDNSYWPALTLSKIEAILDAFIDKWPKVDLPSNWGSESPNEEHAYRFLTELTWSINKNESDEALLVVERLIADPRFTNLHKNLRSIQAGKIRQNGLRDFEPPTPREIVNRLDSDAVVTVEGLRQLVIQELQEFQKSIDGGEFNSGDRFYEKGERLGEVRSTLIISERLNLRLEPKGISITPEHQLKDANRSDFTATKMIRGKRRLLVTEVKGQWHKDLYTAAAAQLYERYSIHPDAEQQGIFLAIWFGATEEVAGRKKHGIKTAQELKCSIEASLPPGLIGLVEVFVLDVSCAYA